MSSRLWIDDLRAPPIGFTHIARSYNEAIRLLSLFEFSHVSFDFDLSPEHYAGDYSLNRTGEDIALWCLWQAQHGELKRFSWDVHSMNPHGLTKIRRVLDEVDGVWGTGL